MSAAPWVIPAVHGGRRSSFQRWAEQPCGDQIRATCDARSASDMSPRRLAIVPARGGSKRVPDKNIRNFGGRPMIAHILETAQLSDLFDQIHVSTESSRIAAV